MNEHALARDLPLQTVRPLISIVTCTWDSERYLSETLKSVERQTYRNLEHIFVDGGSTDRTLELIGQVQGNVTVIGDVRGGIAKAMNSGITMSRGEIILHLHSDDYLPHDRCLENVVGHFQRSGCQWMFGRSIADYRGSWSPEVSDFPRYTYGRLVKGNIIPHCATYVRKSLFDRVGLFDESLRYAMDYDMWLRMGATEPPLQTRELLGVFRFHSGSTTYANRMASFMEDHEVRLRYVNPRSPSRLLHLARYLKRRTELARALRDR
jgi:glycosyltransferase involved in cell wall biosynthesis